MKKTLIALVALAGVASAAEVGTTYALDNTFTVDGDSASVILPVASGDTTFINLDKLVHSGFSTTLTLDKMAGAYALNQLEPGQTLAVTSIQVVSRPDTTERPADAIITLSSGDTVLATSKVADYSALVGDNRGLITFNFAQPVDIDTLSTLKLTFTASGKGFGYTCYYVKGSTTLESDTPTFSKNGVDYHMAVRLNTMVTPEPATATLSLLALAGLAARRRRH